MLGARAAGLLAAGLGAGAAFGCARPEAPPGGPEDRFPPYVVETRPDTFALVEPGTTEFHLRFSERISERPSQGQMDDAVIVSPSAGNTRVEHSRDGITVKVQHALAPGLVYRITVLPVIADMFGNRLRDPFDLVVSTGADFQSNVIAGAVEDRTTGEAVAGVRVDAEFDDAAEGGAPSVHWNYTGADGVFSLRYLPTGAFRVRAWQDRNRDDSLGVTEPRSAYQAAQLGAGADTSLLALSLVEPDTTPARLARVTVEDSVTLRFEFDDYLEPYRPGAAAEGTVARETESGDTARAALRLFHEHEHRRWLAERPDSASPDAGADTTRAGAPLDAAQEAGPTAADASADLGVQDPVGLAGLLLPSQNMVGVLEQPLERGVPYEVALSGVGNLGGVLGDQLTSLFMWEAVEDSTALSADSAAAATDTLAVDTLATDTLATLRFHGPLAVALRTDPRR